MIRQLEQHELTGTFFPLLADIECGEGFNINNTNHVSWLKRKIEIHLFSGVCFFGYFTEDGTPAGLLGVLVQQQLEGIAGCEQKAELPCIGVFPEYRGRGIGSALLTFAEGYAKDKGMYCLYLSTDAVSYENIAFYVRNGYAPVAVLPDVHGPGLEGEVFLRKLLR